MSQGSFEPEVKLSLFFNLGLGQGYKVENLSSDFCSDIKFDL